MGEEEPMLRKVILAATTVVMMAGTIGATTGAAEARSNRHNGGHRVQVCEPVFKWVWRHHHRVKIRVGRDCHWVWVRDRGHDRDRHHDRDRRRNWNY